MTEPRHPDVSVRLVGTDGNAFAVLGTVRRALIAADVDASPYRRDKVRAEAALGIAWGDPLRGSPTSCVRGPRRVV
jgi:hypothetical protein